MSLTREQLTRAYTAEARQMRLAHLQQLSYQQLHELLAGDPVQAAVWIRAAAECGLAAAQLRLGRMLLEGTGVPRDVRAAFGCFVRAAAQNNAEAMNMVGRCLENGWGVEINLKEAAAKYRASAEAGHDWGEYNFGNLLFDGHGVSCDRRLAVYWYLRASRQGHGRAMNLLGRCLEEGWGCEPDRVAAALWYERSAESGYFRGQFNYAAVLAQHGQAEAAASWYRKAAEVGDRAIRGAILAALVNAVHPALREARARVAALLQAA